MALGRIEVDEVTAMPSVVTSERGFTLFESVMALLLLTIGLLGLAQVLYAGLNIASTSSQNLVAREKAREAIESVHTARDTGTITWAQIRNVNAPRDCPAGTTGTGGGRFVNGEQPMEAPGPDGLVNTADDTGQELLPGPDNVFDTADDVPLAGYTRRVDICDVAGNPDLRQIIVTVGFYGSNAIGARQRTYRLTTFISSYS